MLRRLAAALSPPRCQYPALQRILSIAGGLEQFVFQGVHMVLDRAVGRPWPPGGQRTSKLVFIGRELDAGELRHGLNGCVVGAA